MGVCAAASPALRAPAGPTFDARPTKMAPCRAATFSVAAGSAEASSTTTTAPTPARVASKRSNWSLRSRTGTTTVTSPTEGERAAPFRSGCGVATKDPEDTRRRASAPSDGRSPTVSPADHRSTRSRAREDSRNSRNGLPPMTTESSSKRAVVESASRPKEAGSGVSPAAGAARMGEGPAPTDVFTGQFCPSPCPSLFKRSLQALHRPDRLHCRTPIGPPGGRR